MPLVAVHALSILTGPNILCVLLEYSNFSISITMAIQSKYLGGAPYPWPHTT